MTDYKYIKNINNETGVGTILLYAPIGGNDGIDGQAFAYEVEYLASVCTSINVRINSGGGSIVEGYAMVSSMLNCPITIDVYIDGLAASMAGVIALCGDTIHMVDYGLFMIHNPSGGEKEVLDKFKDTLALIMSNRSGVSMEKLSDLMDKETWLNAAEAKKLGLVDEIIKMKTKVKVSKDTAKNTSVEDLMNIFNGVINGDITTESDLIQSNPIQKEEEKMDLIKNKLNLPEGTEIELVNSIDELQSQRDKLMNDLEVAANEKIEIEKKVTELEEKLQSYKDEELKKEEEAKEAKKVEIEEMVNTYVKSARIKAEDKTKYINLATHDFDTTKELLDRVGVKQSIDIINQLEKSNSTVKLEGRDAWTIRDWEKNDPSGLLKLKNENETMYNELFNSFYKK